jgi:hypothetical protein
MTDEDRFLSNLTRIHCSSYCLPLVLPAIDAIIGKKLSLEQRRNGRSTVLPSSPNYDLLGGKEKTLTKETRSNYEGGANGKYNDHSSNFF